MELTLYHTSGCHLCELAEHELVSLSWPFVKIDIAHSAELVSEFGWLIPVLQDERGRRLCWPFDAQTLIVWQTQRKP